MPANMYFMNCLTLFMDKRVHFIGIHMHGVANLLFI